MENVKETASGALEALKDSVEVIDLTVNALKFIELLSEESGLEAYSDEFAAKVEESLLPIFQAYISDTILDGAECFSCSTFVRCVSEKSMYIFDAFAAYDTAIGTANDNVHTNIKDGTLQDWFMGKYFDGRKHNEVILFLSTAATDSAMHRLYKMSEMEKAKSIVAGIFKAKKDEQH